jgi:glucose-6-phosphate 1-dehydrogenase
MGTGIHIRPSVAITIPKRTGADPCTVIIMGAMGDLTRRKLMPAIYQLAKEGLLPDDFAVLGTAREAATDDVFRDAMHEALAKSDEIKNLDPVVWEWLRPRLHFVSGDLSRELAYGDLKKRLEQLEAQRNVERRNRMFYLAVPPSVFTTIVKHLAESGLAPRISSDQVRPWSRVVIEKPFGHSLETATELNALVLSLFNEHQVYRIDHYLGKETVQNVLVLRFANTIFEPLWNRQWIDHVQITASETVGVERRGKYYEEAGVLRDMFQNHLLQLLALTAMEAPSRMDAGSVRDEKVKVLRSIRWLTPRTIPENAVRAQYGAGEVGGKVLPAYRDELDVSPESVTPTYAALRLYVDNWRWNGVPFFLRSGKRLQKRCSEIAVQFRTPPHLMFGGETQQTMQPNTLVMRVQPNEGVSMSFEAKVPGAAAALTSEIEVASVDMDFSYSDAFGEATAPAYETLLLDVMIGEATLFTRSDEVEAAWRMVDPVLKFWESNPPRALETYPAGSSGPDSAIELAGKNQVRWRAL